MVTSSAGTACKAFSRGVDPAPASAASRADSASSKRDSGSLTAVGSSAGDAPSPNMHDSARTSSTARRKHSGVHVEAAGIAEGFAVEASPAVDRAPTTDAFRVSASYVSENAPPGIDIQSAR